MIFLYLLLFYYRIYEWNLHRNIQLKNCFVINNSATASKKNSPIFLQNTGTLKTGISLIRTLFNNTSHNDNETSINKWSYNL